MIQVSESSSEQASFILYDTTNSTIPKT